MSSRKRVLPKKFDEFFIDLLEYSDEDSESGKSDGDSRIEIETKLESPEELSSDSKEESDSEVLLDTEKEMNIIDPVSFSKSKKEDAEPKFGPKNWTQDFSGSNPFRIPTRGVTYTTLTKESICTPFDAFQAIFTIEILKYLVKTFNQINRRRKLNAASFTIRNLLEFIAIILRMCTDHRRASRDYWSKDERRCDPTIKSCMTGKYFEKMNGSLHFGDTSIFTLIEKLNKSFKSVWKLGNHLALDESMVPYRGKSGHKRHIPRKPHP